MSRLRLTPRRHGGFTLIELLVVIAIIAILSAILLPVFFGVREKVRQGTAMDNFRQITSALEKYKSDHHQYPPVLFGYASATPTAMSSAKPGTGLTGPTGLYPLYINDPTVFTDPNNPVTPDKSTVWSTAPVVNTLSNGTLQPVTGLNFYQADAYDANVVLSSPGTTGTTPVTRYQLAWTSFPPQAPYTAADGARQLVNPSPTADTFVTCTTYHAGSGIGQGKVLVLFQGGNVKTMDDSQFLGEITGGADGQGTGFWKVTP